MLAPRSPDDTAPTVTLDSQGVPDAARTIPAPPPDFDAAAISVRPMPHWAPDWDGFASDALDDDNGGA